MLQGSSHILQHFKEFYVNINDIVTEQDDEKVYEKMRKLVSNFIHSRKFESNKTYLICPKQSYFYLSKLIQSLFAVFMAIVSCINAFQTRLRTFNVSYLIVLIIMEKFFIGLFIAEIFAKWYCGFLLFWTDYWNIADFIIIVISQVSL